MSNSPGAVSPRELQITFPALDNTLGAMLIGTGMSSILAGVFVHQTFRYFRRYPKDHWSSKAAVTILCVLDIVHEALIIHTCYYYMVSHYFQPIILLSGVWSLRFVIPTTGIISMISHMFFARRVIILAGNKCLFVPVAAISALLILSELAFCAVATFAIFRDVTFQRFVDRSSWIISASLGTRVLTDSVISGAMVAMLRRNRTGFKRTDSILDLLISFAINTGLLMSVINLGAMISAVLQPDALIYCAIYIVSSKLYSNSVLAVWHRSSPSPVRLNSRQSRNKNRTEHPSTGTSWLEMSDHVAAAVKTSTNTGGIDLWDAVSNDDLIVTLDNLG
ncbi:hypothetical protein GSI_05492 [Ganoderma sinense ZZ0214-1]|uniref:DUF6534 domain-containing protein n=1 Tax=Ganoderma sinense ZZ0214-1 TaxID=1077348 RepID=A0A2G8SEX4_9APHY|nr:hypothetical protein GSI_05492 [Ganoderma sinense ZZ0214-1]